MKLEDIGELLIDFSDCFEVEAEVIDLTEVYSFYEDDETDGF